MQRTLGIIYLIQPEFVKLPILFVFTKFDSLLGFQRDATYSRRGIGRKTCSRRNNLVLGLSKGD